MKVTKVRRNDDGDITNVMLDDGTTMALTKAVALAKRGRLDSIIVDKNRNGVEVIASSPNAVMEDRLENLPTF